MFNPSGKWTPGVDLRCASYCRQAMRTREIQTEPFASHRRAHAFLFFDPDAFAGFLVVADAGFATGPLKV